MPLFAVQAIDRESGTQNIIKVLAENPSEASSKVAADGWIIGQVVDLPDTVISQNFPPSSVHRPAPVITETKPGWFTPARMIGLLVMCLALLLYANSVFKPSNRDSLKNITRIGENYRQGLSPVETKLSQDIPERVDDIHDSLRSMQCLMLALIGCVLLTKSR